MKTQKGITLIALIITIIVLLIIAVVAIGVVQKSGIVEHAQNAASQYSQKKGEEESNIIEAEKLIDKSVGIETPLKAVDFKYFNIVDLGNGTARIAGFNPQYKLPDGNYGEDDYIITDLIIPSKGIYNGSELTVVGFMSSSFRDCSTIKTLVIPETVEEIDPYAFYGCTNLIKVEIPSSVKTIGANVFGNCSSDLKIDVDKYESECSSWTPNWFGSAKEVIFKKN